MFAYNYYSMGWDLWSVGRHNLRLGDVKSVARQWYDFIDISFLPSQLKEKYKEEIAGRLDLLEATPM